MRQNTGRPADPKSGVYRLNEFLPLERVDLTANAWREVKLVFHGEEVSMTVDAETWSRTLKRARFDAAKRKLLWMQNGGNQGIELDESMSRRRLLNPNRIPHDDHAFSKPHRPCDWSQ